MTKAIEALQKAMQYAVANRPKVGGFPFLAEVLRQAGVSKNTWELPSCQSIYVTKNGNVVSQANPLVSGFAEIPPFNQDALVHALRTDQEGKSTFSEFVEASWKAGVVRYEVDFEKRNVTYYGSQGESYIEGYPAVEVKRT